jgi:hypothetical protein
MPQGMGLSEGVSATEKTGGEGREEAVVVEAGRTGWTDVRARLPYSQNYTQRFFGGSMFISISAYTCISTQVSCNLSVASVRLASVSTGNPDPVYSYSELHAICNPVCHFVPSKSRL